MNYIDPEFLITRFLKYIDDLYTYTKCKYAVITNTMALIVKF